LLRLHTRDKRLGIVLGADGMLTLFPGRVRIPDVSFIPWSQIPSGRWPDEAIPEIPPDLAVEVLSPSNTPSEIRLKIREYFQAGTRLVWVIDPKKQTARTYTAPESSRAVGKSGSLDGGIVLPGFRVSLPELFGVLEEGPADKD
jgi:Uma2 family endonuclease